MTTKTIVWQTKPGPQTEFEREYLEKVLFRYVEFENIYDGFLSASPNQKIVIISHNQPQVDPQLRRYFSGRECILIVHLSGENLFYMGDIYEHAAFTLRCYYDPRIARRHVLAIPLGFKSGMLNNEMDPLCWENRDLTWFFAGEIKNDRKAMLEAFRRLQPHHYHLTTGWNSSEGLTVAEMRSFLRRSLFSPCPFGWINPDSFRIMESLEFGAIPVSVKFKGIDYFKYIYGDHPFIIGDDWRDAADQVESLLRDLEQLRGKQETLVCWYREFKERLSRDVASIVAGRTENLVSSQFPYQNTGKQNRRLQGTFSWHFAIEPKLQKLKSNVVQMLRSVK